MIEKQILGLLKKNSPKKFYSSEIEDAFGISGVTVRESINLLRKNEEPICSDRTGYWYSDNPKEIKSTIDNLNGRVSGMNNAIGGLQTAYSKATSTTPVRFKIQKRGRP